MKKIVTIVMAITLVIAMAATLGACTQTPPATTAPASAAPTATPADTATTAPSPTAQKEFKIGLECAYAPFNWTQTDDSNGAVPIDGGIGYANGYDIQIAKKIADGLGMKLVVKKTAWDGLPPALESGVIDAIIAGMSPTAERKQTIDFTDNYYRSQLVIVVKKDGKYANATSLADFAGAKITAQLNTFHYTVIPQITGVVKKTAMKDFPAMRVALQSGIIDGYISELPEGISAAAALPEFKYIEFAADKGFKTSDDDVAVAVGIKKGQPDLIAAINKILAGIPEAERKQIMEDAIKNQPAQQ